MSGPDDLFVLAKEYLTACEAAVATTIGGPIGRAYVTPGPPALDCVPQLTVHVGGPAESDTLPLQPPLMPGERTRVQGAVHLVALTAIVARCIPTLESGQSFPDWGLIEAAAQETNADLWAVWAHVRKGVRDGTLFARPSGRREVFFDPAVPLNPAGGAGGWQVPLRVQLDGYAA